jgi:hypothetical protein
MKTKSSSVLESPSRTNKRSDDGLTPLRIKTRVKFPIGSNLVIIISILLIISLGAVIFMVSGLSTQDTQRTAEDNNFTVNQRAGSQAESEFKAIHAAALLFIESVERLSPETFRDPQTELFCFDQNPNIAALNITRTDVNNSPRTIFIPSTQFVQTYNVNIDDIENYFASSLQYSAHVPTDDSAGNIMQLVNASPAFKLFMTNALFSREG